MITDEISELHTRYSGKFGHKPDRIYLGKKEICELISFYMDSDQPFDRSIPIMGMDIIEVKSASHMFVTRAG